MILLESPEQENRVESHAFEGKSILNRWSRVVLLVFLSIVVFALASLSMYGAWAAAYMLNDTTRGVAALFVWIATFGAGTIALWRIAQGIAAEGAKMT